MTIKCWKFDGLIVRDIRSPEREWVFIRGLFQELHFFCFFPRFPRNTGICSILKGVVSNVHLVVIVVSVVLGLPVQQTNNPLPKHSEILLSFHSLLKREMLVGPTSTVWSSSITRTF